MNAVSWEPARTALMLGELRLPTIARLWTEFAERSDKEGWPAGRFRAATRRAEPVRFGARPWRALWRAERPPRDRVAR